MIRGFESSLLESQTESRPHPDVIIFTFPGLGPGRGTGRGTGRGSFLAERRQGFENNRADDVVYVRRIPVRTHVDAVADGQVAGMGFEYPIITIVFTDICTDLDYTFITSADVTVGNGGRTIEGDSPVAINHAIIDDSRAAVVDVDSFSIGGG